MRLPVGPVPVPGKPCDLGGRSTCWRWTGLLAAGAVALLVMVAARWTPLYSADRSVSDRLHRVAVGNPVLTRAGRILTDWAWDPVTMRILALAAVVLLAAWQAVRLALWIAATSLAGLAVQAGLKAAVARPRPRYPDAVDSANGWAFPSGHAMTATITCGLLLMTFLLLGRGGPLLKAAVWAVAAVSAAGAGFTRILLGVHWWSDVAAGWLLGGAVLALCSGVFLPWRGTRYCSAASVTPESKEVTASAR